MSDVALTVLDLALVVAVARTVGALAMRIGEPRIAGEMLGAILIGPTVLGGQIEGVVDGAQAAGLTGSLFPALAVDALTWIGAVGMILYMLLVGLTIDPAPIGRRLGTILALVAATAGSMALLALIAAPWLSSDGGWKGPDATSLAFALALGAGARRARRADRGADPRGARAAAQRDRRDRHRGGRLRHDARADRLGRRAAGRRRRRARRAGADRRRGRGRRGDRRAAGARAPDAAAAAGRGRRAARDRAGGGLRRQGADRHGADRPARRRHRRAQRRLLRAVPRAPPRRRRARLAAARLPRRRRAAHEPARLHRCDRARRRDPGGGRRVEVGGVLRGGARSGLRSRSTRARSVRCCSAAAS